MDTVTASYSGGLLSNDAYAEERTNRKGEPDFKWYIWAWNLCAFHRVWLNVFLFFYNFLEPFYFSLQLQYPNISPGDLVALLIIDWVHWAWILSLYFKFIIREWNKVYGILPFYVPGSFTVKEHPSFVSIHFCSIEIIFEHVTACLKG